MDRFPLNIRLEKEGFSYSSGTSKVEASFESGSTLSKKTYQDAFTSFDTVCASHPIDLIREKTRGGVEPKGEIVFYTIEDLRPVDERSSSGDIVIYKGERYRIVSTKRWGSFSASVGERQENQ